MLMNFHQNIALNRRAEKLKWADLPGCDTALILDPLWDSHKQSLCAFVCWGRRRTQRVVLTRKCVGLQPGRSASLIFRPVSERTRQAAVWNRAVCYRKRARGQGIIYLLFTMPCLNRRLSKMKAEALLGPGNIRRRGGGEWSAEPVNGLEMHPATVWLLTCVRREYKQ